jgi:hypothetical protein
VMYRVQGSGFKVPRLLAHGPPGADVGAASIRLKGLGFRV